MEPLKYRRHPRVYKKQTEQVEDNSINLSGAAAIGILALVFVKGVFLGYMINKKWSK
ncbi:MAG: hypothetical protein N2484_13970 [Clostridia bacterium]|nr:hypothetical protein [Clostridia bacterium]